MAVDPVKSGAIYRLKNLQALKSPIPHIINKNGQNNNKSNDLIKKPHKIIENENIPKHSITKKSIQEPYEIRRNFDKLCFRSPKPKVLCSNINQENSSMEVNTENSIDKISLNKTVKENNQEEKGTKRETFSHIETPKQELDYGLKSIKKEKSNTAMDNNLVSRNINQIKPIEQEIKDENQKNKEEKSINIYTGTPYLKKNQKRISSSIKKPKNVSNKGHLLNKIVAATLSSTKKKKEKTKVQLIVTESPPKELSNCPKQTISSSLISVVANLFDDKVDSPVQSKILSEHKRKQKGSHFHKSIDDKKESNQKINLIQKSSSSSILTPSPQIKINQLIHSSKKKKVRSNFEEKIDRKLCFMEYEDKRKSKRKRKTTEVYKPEILMETKPIKQSKDSIELFDWYIKWPPEYHEEEEKSIYVLSIKGKTSINTKPIIVHIMKRMNTHSFLDKNQIIYHLNGMMNVDHAMKEGVPQEIIQEFLDGLPPLFMKKYLKMIKPYISKKKKQSTLIKKNEKKKTILTKPKKNVEESNLKQKKIQNSKTKLSMETSNFEEMNDIKNEEKIPKKKSRKDKKIKKNLNENSENEFQSSRINITNFNAIRRTRSGRCSTPVMEWWRGQRLVTDAKGITVMDIGSKDQILTPTPKKRIKKKKMKEESIEIKNQQNQIDSIRFPPKKTISMNNNWSDEQLRCLRQAFRKVDTTHSQFWTKIAEYVENKTSLECQSKWFEQFQSPEQKPKTKGTKQEKHTQSNKLAGITTQKYKKQIREFVKESEKTHADDLFENKSFKSSILESIPFDDLKSPKMLEIKKRKYSYDINSSDYSTPQSKNKRIYIQNDNKLEEENEEEEEKKKTLFSPCLLRKNSQNTRHILDSYVHRYTKQQKLQNKGMKSTKSMTSKPLSYRQKEKISMKSSIGSHQLQGSITPGGTTRIKIMNSDGEEENDSDLILDEDYDFSDASDSMY